MVSSLAIPRPHINKKTVAVAAVSFISLTVLLSLRAVDNPFNTGADQRFTINEGEDLTLSGDITGGFGDVTYRWYVSSDGGKHWDLVEEAHGTSLDLKNMGEPNPHFEDVAPDLGFVDNRQAPVFHKNQGRESYPQQRSAGC